MRPLIIDADVRGRLEKIREYADAHPLTIRDLVRNVPMGDNPNHACLIPVGFKLVYSVEDQPAPLGRVRHLSMSIPGELERVPNPYGVLMLAEIMGFWGGWADMLKVELVPFADGTKAATIWQRWHHQGTGGKNLSNP